MPRDASSSEHSTSSLTALALAPGVLNTGMPSSVMRATGMLLVPAPQRTMPRTVGFTSDSCSLCERSMMAMGESGSLLSSPATAYLPDGNFLRPTGEMALKVSTVKALPLYSLPPSTALHKHRASRGGSTAGCAKQSMGEPVGRTALTALTA
eukprot:350329-Chlamydomonas_euryale.AAC.3